MRHLEIKFLWLQEAVRRKKVVLSKVRGDVNPADVLTKPKSLDDMKQLLGFSCIDWCDSAHVNDVNHFCIDGRTFRPRGGVGQWIPYPGPYHQWARGIGPNHLNSVEYLTVQRKSVGSYKSWSKRLANA